jgi:hypothetical protein
VVLTVALAGVLAVGVADSTIRLPGTTLRFGHSPERITSGAFQPAAPGARTADSA